MSYLSPVVELFGGPSLFRTQRGGVTGETYWRGLWTLCSTFFGPPLLDTTSNCTIDKCIRHASGLVQTIPGNWQYSRVSDCGSGSCLSIKVQNPFEIEHFSQCVITNALIKYQYPNFTGLNGELCRIRIWVFFQGRIRVFFLSRVGFRSEPFYW